MTIPQNGIPIITAEIKNALTRQTVENAMWQYRHDIDPREAILDFKRRALVHFAVDTEAMFMAGRRIFSSSTMDLRAAREGGRNLQKSVVV